jgi:DNA polymerase alpha subunit A
MLIGDGVQGIVQGRLARDDFVVDDGADGYVDNGQDDWGQDDRHSSEDEAPPRRKCAPSPPDVHASTLIHPC